MRTILLAPFVVCAVCAGCGDYDDGATPRETAAPACAPAAPDDDDFDSGDEPEYDGEDGAYDEPAMGFDRNGDPCVLDEGGDYLIDE